LTSLSALSWPATTAAPLTLHLSRASALENAGICLHPLYGFVYLPGSGLKGMAGAYAETVCSAAKADIERVFGRAPKGKIEGWAGSVIFHDAWPEAWPKLVIDIVNNHHKRYYRGEDAPGDWEDPEPSCFLALKPGVTFAFALSPRRDSDVGDLDLAKDWLAAALCHLGAGAKTAAGYGAFRLAEPQPPSPARVANDQGRWAEWSGTLELVTPAFLAGAGQQQDDCDLRPATLRGLLRWWWRTMHAAHLSLADLRRLEGAVWGNTEAGSPIRIVVDATEIRKRRFHLKTLVQNKNGKATLVLNTQEAQEHDIKAKTGPAVPGVLYAAYGMDEMDAGDVSSRKIRWFAEAGSRWHVKLIAHASRYPTRATRAEKHIVVSAGSILEQAGAALWLLCHFGGVGSRARKGFGSFKDIDGLTVDECRNAAKRFRAACGMVGPMGREASQAKTPALENRLPVADLSIGTEDPWKAADKLGSALQEFNKSLTDKKDRRVLGLPRAAMTGPEGKRHAAPMHFHVFNGDNGSLSLRVAAFPAPKLPDVEKSRSVLTNLIAHLAKTFATAPRTKAPRAPSDRFAAGERLRTPEGDEVKTVDRVSQVAKTMWVELVNLDGKIETDEIPVAGCVSLDYP
jgi:CRISPR-associated protein Cmr6